MASTTSHPLLSLPRLRLRLQALHNTHSMTSAAPPHINPLPQLRPKSLSATRRDFLFLLTTTPILTVLQPPQSRAEDIPLFGLRKKIRTAEEKAEEVLREGFEAAERGVEAAEKGIEAAEKGIEATEKGIVSAEMEIESSAVSFNGLAQAGVVAGAEVFGVAIAASVVSGILRPEGQKS